MRRCSFFAGVRIYVSFPVSLFMWRNGFDGCIIFRTSRVCCFLFHPPTSRSGWSLDPAKFRILPDFCASSQFGYLRFHLSPGGLCPSRPMLPRIVRYLVSPSGFVRDVVPFPGRGRAQVPHFAISSYSCVLICTWFLHFRRRCYYLIYFQFFGGSSSAPSATSASTIVSVFMAPFLGSYVCRLVADLFSSLLSVGPFYLRGGISTPVSLSHSASSRSCCPR